MAPKIKIPVRRTGRALAHLHSKPSTHTRLVPHFAGTLRSPQNEMRSAHGAIRTSAHLRRTSVLRSKTLAEGEFISPEHFNFLKGIKKRSHNLRCDFFFWSGRRGSNSLPPPWQGGALPDELRPRNIDDNSRFFCVCQAVFFIFPQIVDLHC